MNKVISDSDIIQNPIYSFADYSTLISSFFISPPHSGKYDRSRWTLVITSKEIINITCKCLSTFNFIINTINYNKTRAKPFFFND